MTSEWSLSDDLSGIGIGLVLVVASFAVGLLLLELRARERGSGFIVTTGVLSVMLFTAAVLRPVDVGTRGSVVGPRVAVLVDDSRRLLIPTRHGTRREVALEAADAIGRALEGARVSTLAFGDEAPKPLVRQPGQRLSTETDLSTAMRGLAGALGERPQAVVVISDGRLARPGADEGESALRRDLGQLGVPVHTVRVVDEAPVDASIRSVRAAGAAVAHQPIVLTVEIGCSETLDCGEVPVSIHELRQGSEPAPLATGTARVRDGSGTVELEVTLDRAGARVIQVSLDPPEADTIAENNRRLFTFSVARERVRLLHLAGRPTYDVRALRRWLKSDQAVDTVAFFILRGKTDDPEAQDYELALIEFPVHELFTTHLPSFDAIILQDIDAVEYKLAQYLPRVARYVEAGGGLIMVGGPASFAGGNYAGTPLDRILPVEPTQSGQTADTTPFVPRYTEAGRAAPVTHALRELMGEELPTQAGANLLGGLRSGAIALWEHPKIEADGAPMPILAMGEAGDGRSIALAVDSTHRLAFGQLASRAAGRAYGALWDGLLGWLMRDPRYEAARVELTNECIVGEPTTFRVQRLPGMKGKVELWLEQLGESSAAPRHLEAQDEVAGIVDIRVDGLEAGGYTVRAQVGAAPPTRRDFACERGGAAWSDTRPDPARLRAIAKATGGVSVTADEAGELPWPPSTQIAAERTVTPLAPPWVWTVAAATLLGVHWVARRRGGLV